MTKEAILGKKTGSYLPEVQPRKKRKLGNIHVGETTESNFAASFFSLLTFAKAQTKKQTKKTKKIKPQAEFTTIFGLDLASVPVTKMQVEETFLCFLKCCFEECWPQSTTA